MSICRFCGKENEDWMQICQDCGNPIVDPSKEEDNDTTYSNEEYGSNSQSGDMPSFRGLKLTLLVLCVILVILIICVFVM